VMSNDLGFDAGELDFYIGRLLALLTSCRARRFAEYEHQDWWSFVGAEPRSQAYKKYCADGITRACVACRADKMSSRTGGYVLMQLLMDLVRTGQVANRVLCGPTNEVWIQPWLDYLQKRGVDYHPDAKVEKIHYQDGRITGVTVREKGGWQEAKGDYYIAALPVEALEPKAASGAVVQSPSDPLLTEEMKQAAPSLRNLHQLQTE